MDESPSSIESLVERSASHVGETAHPELDPRPRLHLTVVTCMDARLEVERTLGTSPGDIHVVRNAGGVVTDDVLRSVILSQRELGTAEVMVIQHTKCGLLGFDESQLRSELLAEVGEDPGFAFLGFDDVVTSVRRSLRMLDRSPFIGGLARGFVFDVDRGTLDEVSPLDRDA